jgi:hypothetical protein
MTSFGSYIYRISRVMILTAVLSVPAFATNVLGTITYKTAGMVNPAPLTDALITIYNTTSGARVITRSGAGGVFAFKGIAAGSYVVIVEKNGRRLYQGKVNAQEPQSRLDIRL